MPWKECSVMDERLQFVARRLAGEPMAELYRKFRQSEAAEGLGIVGEFVGKKLQGDVATQLQVFRFVHDAHQLPFAYVS